jgi:hypothetical protein
MLYSFPWKDMIQPNDISGSMALKLFVSSVFMLNNTALQKYASNISDCITSYLHTIIPVGYQIRFREVGGISFLMDTSALLMGVQLCSRYPLLLLDMYHVSNQISTYQYGETSNHYIEMFPTATLQSSVDAVEELKEPSQKKELIEPRSMGETLVFVHGGAWGCGRTWQYRLIANGIACAMGVKSVVVIGYPTYPAATIAQQRDCVSAALRFIQQTASVKRRLFEINMGTYSCKCDDLEAAVHTAEVSVILCGHSSGANICALSLLKEHFEEQPVLSVSASLTCTPTISSGNGTGAGTCTMLPVPLLPRPLLPHVSLFLGLCGVYNIEKHYLFERNRGVHLVSPMTAAAGGREQLSTFSPTLLARALAQEWLSSSSSSSSVCRLKRADVVGNEVNTSPAEIAAFFPFTVLIHGENDSTVPRESSEEFAD